MKCPVCFGHAEIIGRHERAGYVYINPCPNPDCHAGEVHCCDGIQAQPEPNQESRACETAS